MSRKFAGARLRQERLAAGIKSEQLALDVGRSVFSIHQYESGRVVPSTPILCALADRFGLRVDDLFVEAVTDDAA